MWSRRQSAPRVRIRCPSDEECPLGAPPEWNRGTNGAKKQVCLLQLMAEWWTKGVIAS
jgi:hypothetical protein